MQIQDQNNKNKTLGYSLIFLGISMIVVVALYSFLIFTAKAQFPQVFSEAPMSELQKQSAQQDIQKMMIEQISGQVKSVFYDFTPRMMNIISWSIFAWIIIMAGGKISQIGKDLL